MSVAPRRTGITQYSALERAQWPQSALPGEVFEALPVASGPAPYRASSQQLGISSSSPLRLLVIGDHGGVADPNPQKAVAAAMSAWAPAPDAVYSVGDVVYYNGEQDDYSAQFYEPYAHLLAPIVGIPGNHDGDTSDVAGRSPLDAFMANFCSSAPGLPLGAQQFQRDTQTQPYCYWTLLDELATIVGVYTNVPSGGVVESAQAAWLAGELAAAPSDRALIVCLHHPPFSCDADHGGSLTMGQVLDTAFAAAERQPDLVLSGHVHNYQRFERAPGPQGKALTYVVCGAGGYHNTHAMAPGAEPGLQVTPDTTLQAFCVDGMSGPYGFLTLTIDAQQIAGEYVSVTLDGTVTSGVDTFTIALG